MKKILSSVLVAGMLLGVGATASFAIGGPSGAKVDYLIQGQIGEVIVNPYDIAPLTAIIRNGGYDLKDVKVRIVPKKGGQEIKYSVSNKQILTHGGIPVFGLYPDYKNKVEVEYTRILGDKADKLKEAYEIYTAPIYAEPAGIKIQDGAFFTEAVVHKAADKEFSDRLYFLTGNIQKSGKGTQVVWNNPVGGALEWNFYPQNFVIDTKGEIRWYMFAEPIYDLKSIYNAGVMMGFKQNDDGALTWGYGQRYAKYDLMGRKIFNRQLPIGYNDFSHSLDNSPNGNYFLRVASSNQKRLDGKNVRTVRDVVIEVDENGVVLDEWKLYNILDPYRDVNMKVLDQGAVCLNIDASMAGKTLSSEDLAKMDESDKFGDIVGSGPGRNWAHINSVDHDTEDDSIILSSRHQSAIIKIGRDKKVKWILGSHEGWSDKFKPFLLQPVDSKGNKISCGDSGSKCPGYLNEKGGFDYTWTQHTAFKIDAKSKGDILYVTAFDNGDSRGMEQPALPSMKYSRAVIYKIDQKKMTVEQVWEYGKNRGNSWYSPVTSLTEYHADKDSVVVYSATAGTNFNLQTGAFESLPNPYLMEFKWGAKEPSFEIQLKGISGYQAMPISLKKAFEN